MRIVGCFSKLILPGTLQAKVGYPKNPQAFSKACFLSSVVLSLQRYKLNEANSEPALKDLICLMKVCNGDKHEFFHVEVGGKSTLRST